VDFGVQQALTDNYPSSVLTWQIGVADIDDAIAVCERYGLDYVWTCSDHDRTGCVSPSAAELAQRLPNSA
jgi:hypothetical protein